MHMGKVDLLLFIVCVCVCVCVGGVGGGVFIPMHMDKMDLILQGGRGGGVLWEHSFLHVG